MAILFPQDYQQCIAPFRRQLHERALRAGSPDHALGRLQRTTTGEPNKLFNPNTEDTDSKPTDKALDFRVRCTTIGKKN
ncbi:MAG: hypothetical protein JW706_02360, partial [Opitutales bacterium]|nr:hypothetical protein [Opitutales bacterium]